MRLFRSPLLLTATDVRSDPPVSSISLETENGSRELNRTNDYIHSDIRYKVTYHRVCATGFIATDPITFCSSIFRDQINYELVRRDPKRSEQWIPCSYGSYCQLGVVNSSVSEIAVAQSESFVVFILVKSGKGHSF